MPTIRIPGRPVPKGRPRFKVIGGQVRVFTPATTTQYEQKVAAAWRAAKLPMFDGPVAIEVHISTDGAVVTVVPITVTEASTKLRSDLDNVVKALMDGLNGVAYTDDRQVVQIVAYKVAALPDAQSA